MTSSIHPSSPSSSSSDDEPNYKNKVNFFLFNKFSKYGTRFSHCPRTSCHKAPGWAGGSWLNTWKMSVKPQNPDSLLCSFLECSRAGKVGAHVMYSGSTEMFASWYIVPACHKCNRKHGQAARIKEGTALLKVMKGRVFKPNKILIGTLKTSEYYSRCMKARTIPLPFTYNKTSKREYVENSKNTRRWPDKRIGGWGWKKG